MARTKGERYACERCGAEIEYVKPCNCTSGRHEEICCGQPMQKV